MQVDNRLHSRQTLSLRHHPLVLLRVNQLDTIRVLDGVLCQDVTHRRISIDTLILFERLMLGFVVDAGNLWV